MTNQAAHQSAQRNKTISFPSLSPAPAAYRKSAACSRAQSANFSGFLPITCSTVVNFRCFAASYERRERQQRVDQEDWQTCLLHSLTRNIIGDGNILDGRADDLREELHEFAHAQGFGASDRISFTFVAGLGQRAYRNGRDVARMNVRHFSVTVIREDLSFSFDRVSPIKSVRHEGTRLYKGPRNTDVLNGSLVSLVPGCNAGSGFASGAKPGKFHDVPSPGFFGRLRRFASWIPS